MDKQHGKELEGFEENPKAKIHINSLRSICLNQLWMNSMEEWVLKPLLLHIKLTMFQMLLVAERFDKYTQGTTDASLF